jgi:hypothetical protein
VLKVVNAGAGIGRRGIDITVPAGQSPINVPENAGKASNLNADKLDGKSEEDFLPSRLYGVATGLVNGPGGGKTVLVSGVNLGCDTGDVAISAGGNAVDAEDHLNGIVPFRSSYQIEFTDNGGASRFSANMICADVSKPFRYSAAGGDDVVAVGLQHVDDRVAVIALELDHAVLDRAADAAALLQAPRELLQAVVGERHVVDRRDRLAAATARLALDLHTPARGLARLQRRVAGLAQVAVGRRVHHAGVAGHANEPTPRR